MPTPITLVLADRSIRVPEGILEDVPIKINDCIVPTDFVVLKYRQEPKDPSFWSAIPSYSWSNH